MLKLLSAYILNVLVLCCYIYNIKFAFIPVYSRRLIFFLGVLCFLLKGRRSDLQIIGNALRMMLPFLLGFVMVGIVHIAGGEFYDKYYLQVVITLITSLFSVYFIYKLLEYTCPHSNVYQYFIACSIGAIFFNNMCASTFVLAPPLYDIIQSFQVVQVDSYGIMSDELFEQRLRGLGDNLLFNGGVISSLGLILCMYKILNVRDKFATFTYYIVYFFIMFSGILIARTTIVGIILSLFLLFLNINSNNKWKYLWWVLISIFVIVVVFTLVVQFISPEMASWAFEFVYNYIDSGSVSMASTDELQSMWSIIPTKFITYFIGDGFLFSPTGGGYYKNVDVGFLRFIYYSGLIVMFLLFGMLKRLLDVKLLGIHTGIEKLNFVLLSWVLVMNIKGLCLPLAIILLFYYIRRKSQDVECLVQCDAEDVE